MRLSPETCRIKPLRIKNAIVASCWTYFTTIKHDARNHKYQIHASYSIIALVTVCPWYFRKPFCGVTKSLTLAEPKDTSTFQCSSQCSQHRASQPSPQPYESVSHFLTILTFRYGPGSSVGIATGYGLDDPGIESRWGARFSAPVQTGSGSHPPSWTMGTGSFPGVKCGRGVTLTPHPLLVLWSWKSRAIPLLHLWAVRPAQSLSAKIHCSVHQSAHNNAPVKLLLNHTNQFHISKPHLLSDPHWCVI